MSDDDGGLRWYATRCLVRWPDLDDPILWAYEERITLWWASSFDEAIERGEADAQRYAADVEAEALELVQAFALDGTLAPSDGAEVFSLIRTSDLDSDDYVDRFFDTGDERQGEVDDDEDEDDLI